MLAPKLSIAPEVISSSILSLLLPSSSISSSSFALAFAAYISSTIPESDISFTAGSVAVKSILAELPIISESTSLALIDPIANINNINNPNIGINLLEFMC